MARRRATGNRPAGTPSAEPEDPQERNRLRRRDPNERWLSRSSGFLLLLMLAQAAFGYALVGLATAPWVRHVHLGGAFVVTALTIAVYLFVRRLPWGGPREQVLLGLASPLLVLVFLQLVMGGMAHGLLPGWSADVRMAHIGIGLVVMLLVTLVHIVAIGPSLILSARREYEAGRETLER